MKKRTIATVILTGLILATTAFIWWQSLRARADSADTSNALQQWLAALLGPWIEGTFLFEQIRKLAHFVEFALLGGEWWALGIVCRRRWLPLLGGLTAVVDELLQFAAPGRAPAVTDVLLDWAGYAVGAGLVWMTVWLVKRRRAA